MAAVEMSSLPSKSLLISLAPSPNRRLNGYENDAGFCSRFMIIRSDLRTCSFQLLELVSHEVCSYDFAWYLPFRRLLTMAPPIMPVPITAIVSAINMFSCDASR